MFKSGYILVVFLVTIYSCDYFQLKDKSKNGEIVASVGTTYLYKSDLLFLYENELPDKDSIVITNNFIESWARKQIILQKATLNLSKEKELELQIMLDNYRDDLYINSYKDALVAQNLDTVVQVESLKSFYSENQNIFRLKEEIFRFRYLNFNTKSVDVKKIKEMFLKSSANDLDSLLFNELKYSTSQLNDSMWFTYKDFIRINPIIKTINKNKLLRKNYLIELKDSINTHFIKVLDFKMQNEIAPLEHVKPIIKQMILHKKKLEFINTLDNKLIEDAIQNNTFKKY